MFFPLSSLAPSVLVVAKKGRQIESTIYFTEIVHNLNIDKENKTSLS